MTSADPISVAFSGELLAMVIIGGTRSFLGPAFGALFFVIFRDYLSSMTENWLLYFGLLFVAFIVFSPTGLVGLGERLLTPFRTRTVEEAAMASRQAGAVELPAFLKPKDHRDCGRNRQELRRHKGRAGRELRRQGPQPPCADWT
jgi:hypothetical protein